MIGPTVVEEHRCRLRPGVRGGPATVTGLVDAAREPGHPRPSAGPRSPRSAYQCRGGRGHPLDEGIHRRCGQPHRPRTSRSRAVVGMDDMRLALLLTPSPRPSAGCWSAARRARRSRPPSARSPRAAARGRRDRAAGSPATRPPRTRPAPTARTTARTAPRRGRRGWSSCRSARPRTASSARSTSSEALTEGVKAYEPGLLAAAHRGVLYVDEVNLLHDHLVDLLLDAAAMGRAYVEREGVSVTARRRASCWSAR